MELAKRIEQLFKTRCAEFKEEYKLNFGVYYTPAESLCYTAMKKFQQKYGKISNISDREYFTNSIHVPVWKTMSPFDKIDVESQLTGYSSAGCITYIELDSGIKNNLSALETLSSLVNQLKPLATPIDGTIKETVEPTLTKFSVHQPKSPTCQDFPGFS